MATVPPCGIGSPPHNGSAPPGLVTFWFYFRWLAPPANLRQPTGLKTLNTYGSKAAFTSTETELKLTNVARASLEELLDDYGDFLRARDLPLWEKNSREAQYVRRLGRETPQTFELYREFVETRPPEVIANLALCLIHQTNYLLDQQMRRLAKDIVEHGGLRERMTRVRLRQRASRSQP